MASFASEGPEDSPSSPLGMPFIDNIRTNTAFALCVAMSLFHLYTAGIGLLQTPVQRAVHVGFVLVLVFLLYPLKRGIRRQRHIKLCPVLADLLFRCGTKVTLTSFLAK